MTKWDEALQRLHALCEPLTVRRIIRNGPATIVLFTDGTKSVVRRGADEPDDQYHAICAAIAKRVVGSGVKVKKLVDMVEFKGSGSFDEDTPSESWRDGYQHGIDTGWNLGVKHVEDIYKKATTTGPIDLEALFHELFDRA